MARQCAICQKGARRAWRRVQLRAEKFNPTIKRVQKPNLHWVKIPLDIKNKKYKPFAGKKILACSKCIKAMGKNK